MEGNMQYPQRISLSFLIYELNIQSAEANMQKLGTSNMQKSETKNYNADYNAQISRNSQTKLKSPLVVVLQTRSDAQARRPSFLEANPEPNRQHNSTVDQRCEMMLKVFLL